MSSEVDLVVQKYGGFFDCCCSIFLFLFLSTVRSNGCINTVMFLFFRFSCFFLLLFDVENRFHDSAFINRECFFRFFSNAFFSDSIRALSLLFILFRVCVLEWLRFALLLVVSLLFFTLFSCSYEKLFNAKSPVLLVLYTCRDLSRGEKLRTVPMVVSNETRAPLEISTRLTHYTIYDLTSLTKYPPSKKTRALGNLSERVDRTLQRACPWLPGNAVMSWKINRQKLPLDDRGGFPFFRLLFQCISIGRLAVFIFFLTVLSFAVSPRKRYVTTLEFSRMSCVFHMHKVFNI